MLSLSHISFSYGLVQILDDVSIEVPKAKVVCVMGRNGVGKTTLMRNIVGLEKASKGSVTLDGRDISKVPARRRAQSGLALVPQGRMIFPRLSVRENLEVGLSARTDEPIKFTSLTSAYKALSGRSRRPVPRRANRSLSKYSSPGKSTMR